MGVYILVYIFILLLLFLAYGSKYEKNKFSFIPICISSCLILLASFRYGIGTDYENYVDIFNNLALYDNISISTVEWGYQSLNILISKIGLGFWALSFISSVIIFLCLFRVLQAFDINIYAGLAIFIALWYMGFNYNIVRHGLATSLVWVAFTYIQPRNILKFILFIVIAGLFHKIAYFFLPFYWLSRMKLSPIITISMIVSSYIIGVYYNIFSSPLINLLINTKIEGYTSGYYEEGYKGYGITLGTILNFGWICMIFAFGKYKDDKFRVLTNILIIGLCISGIFNPLGVFVERLSGVCLYALVGIIPGFLISKNRKIVLGSMFVIIIYSSFYFYTVLSSKEKSGDYQYIPYQSIFNNN